MNYKHLAVALAAAAFTGVCTPFAIPNHWMKYVLGGALLGTLIFAMLCAGTAQDNDPNSKPSILALLILGTERPLARVRDYKALLCFFMGLAYLAGFTVGAFMAVHP